MEPTYSKKNDTTLQVVKTVEPIEETKEYDLDFLRQQEVAILKQMNDFVDARNVELTEVRELLKKAEELGVKSQLEMEQARLDEAPVEAIKPVEVIKG